MSSVPGCGQSVKSRSLEKIISPICFAGRDDLVVGLQVEGQVDELPRHQRHPPIKRLIVATLLE